MKDEVRALAKEHDDHVNNINRLMRKEKPKDRPKAKTVKQGSPNLLKQMEETIKKAKEQQDKKQVSDGKNVIKKMENLKRVSQRLKDLKKAKQEIEKRIQKIENEYKSLLKN